MEKIIGKSTDRRERKESPYTWLLILASIRTASTLCRTKSDFRDYQFPLLIFVFKPEITQKSLFYSNKFALHMHGVLICLPAANTIHALAPHHNFRPQYRSPGVVDEDCLMRAQLLSQTNGKNFQASITDKQRRARAEPSLHSIWRL